VLIDLNSSTAPSELHCDFCVIGGGAVGLAIAADLSRAGRNVVILEAGGVSLEQDSQSIFQGDSIGRPFNNIQVGRYRVLGGTTTFWAGQLVEFDPVIWEHRPWVAPSSWPINHEVMARYYHEAYRLLGLSDLPADAEIWRSVETEAPRLSEGLNIALTRWLPIRNFAKLFKQDIRDSTRLTVVVHANVTSISTDAHSECVHTIASRSLSGNRLAVFPRATVLACGTIEIARLLLQKAENTKVESWHRNSWTGRGFLDHLHVTAGEVDVRDRRTFSNMFDSIHLHGYKYYPTIRLSSNIQREYQLIDVAAQFAFSGRPMDHLENIKMFISSVLNGRAPSNLLEVPHHIASVAKISLPLVYRYLSAHRSYRAADAKVLLTLFAEQIPTPKSFLQLAAATDNLGMQKIQVHWDLDGRELRSLCFMARSIRRALAVNKVADVSLYSQLDEQNPAFLSAVTDAVHHMGTARIGSTPDEGVVDGNLRIFGTQNLYVAGAAVFPTSGYANPTFTAIALGLRLCELLKTKY
jgi:hypothetical protein